MILSLCIKSCESAPSPTEKVGIHSTTNTTTSATTSTTTTFLFSYFQKLIRWRQLFLQFSLKIVDGMPRRCRHRLRRRWHRNLQVRINLLHSFIEQFSAHRESACICSIEWRQRLRWWGQGVIPLEIKLWILPESAYNNTTNLESLPGALIWVGWKAHLPSRDHSKSKRGNRNIGCLRYENDPLEEKKEI